MVIIWAQTEHQGRGVPLIDQMSWNFSCRDGHLGKAIGLRMWFCGVA
jgi:hypothetical protein